MLYVEQGLEGTEVSRLTGISETTISKWNNNEGWEKQRAARRLSPDKLIQRYYEQSERIIDAADEQKRPLTTGEVDSLAKLSISIARLDKRADASIVMSVLRNYNNYLLTVNPDLAKQNTDYQLEYVQSLINAEK